MKWKTLENTILYRTLLFILTTSDGGEGLYIYNAIFASCYEQSMLYAFVAVY